MAKQAKSNIWIDGKQAGATLAELRSQTARLNAEIKRLPRNSEEYRKKLQELQQANQALDQHRQAVRGIGDSYKGVTAQLKDTLKQYAPVSLAITGIYMGIRGVFSAVGQWIQTNRELEKSLSSLKALTGASREDLKFYKKEAIEMGKTSLASASEVVNAYKLVGSAKPELLQNKEALAAVTKEAITLSEAAEIDLGSAVDAVTGTLNQFNKSGKAAPQVINALAAGAKVGASNIESLAQSTEKSGGVAAGFKVTIEENIGALEVLGEKSLKGAEAGTQFKNVLLTMQGIEILPEKSLKMLEKYGVDLNKVKDTSIPFAERLRELSKIQGDGTAIAQVFGRENVVAGQALLQNVDKVKKYTDAVTGTTVAYEMQKEVTDNLDGDLQSLGNTWDTFLLSLNEGGENSEVMREGVQMLTDSVKWLIENFKYIAGWIKKTIVSFLAFKTAMTAVKIVTMAQNGELKKMAQGFFSLKKGAEDGKKGVSGFGGALKGIGWAAAIALALEFVKVLWDITSGAAQAERRLANLEKSREKSADHVAKRQKERQEATSKALNAINRAVQEGTMTEKEAAKQRLELTAQNKKSISEDIESVRGRYKEYKKDLDSYKMLLADRNRESFALAERQKELRKKYGEQIGDGQFEQALSVRMQVASEAIKTYKVELSEVTEEVLDAESAVNSLSKGQENNTEATDKQKEAYKKLRDELNQLANNAEKLKEDLQFNIQVESTNSQEEKDVLEAERRIEEKYAKEIQSAHELAQEKGEIGAAAADLLKSLEITKSNETAFELGKIQKKYADERLKAEEELQDEIKAIKLQQAESLEQAIFETRRNALQANLASLREDELSERRKTLEEIANLEAQQRRNNYQKEFEEGSISKEELELRKRDLALWYGEQIRQINTDTETAAAQAALQNFEAMTANVSQLMDTFSQAFQISSNQQINEIQKQNNERKKGLEDDLKAKVLNQEEYNARIQEIDKQYEDQKKAIQREEDQRNKAIALFNIAINTAQAIVKAAPNVPLQVAAGITGAVQAAVVATTPVPQYDQGGFTVKGARTGRRYKADYMGKLRGGMTPPGAQLALVGEEGPEYITPAPLLNNPVVANAVSVIEAIRTNQFATGGFTQPTVVASGTDPELKKLLAELNYNIPRMRAVYGDNEIDRFRDRADILDKVTYQK